MAERVVGSFAQARHVFLEGCGLPQAWAGQRQWRILQAGFGAGLNFLAAWRAWKDDPSRPGLLHFCSIEASPSPADAIVLGAQEDDALLPLARELAAQWWGLLPGVHRLAFEDGRVLLTLCIGDAREQVQQQAFAADSVFLRDTADLPTLKAVTRLCRRGMRLATPDVPDQVRRDLHQCGFVMESRERVGLAGRFDPSWQVREGATQLAPSTAIVIGAGLAGAAAAASLARRDWDVHVLDAATEPAQGASALPAGLLAPHASPDDNLLSRLSRAGVRMTLRESEMRLRAGEDWSRSGALERRADRAAADLGTDGQPWQAARADGLWHAAAAWIKPATLVRAWLATPGVRWTGAARVTSIEAREPGWRVHLADGTQHDATLVVVAAALGSAALLPALQLHAVRGQVSWDLHDGPALTPAPVNGNGHFLPDVPLAGGRAWLSGSTYGRGDLDTQPRHEDQLANLERMRSLLPDVAAQLADRIKRGEAKAWCGVRCASSDRRPVVGELAPGLWVSTAMGSRGLTFAHLAAELLGARLHAEPLPLPVRLVQALDANR
ncbi:FAD-dependent 5-carboxymethylaminomethyl-2-thiouridine(34) oxidoreductase MnmC [Ramlibacter algicola]|uniref:FAD-dependent 5-carboxymethylaminomethyl-2-thiouridine(34) oxidoreductase MnmC n=1 Tax=Ramlibacter algicola TaxID=2795217 RepID=A0A934US96_9BURK|nr:FAD-dependent 5-carboxymethylaminomethyl-2-thiouridine(34) oxidoreductase MnmC [Ramlibacter algicola]MBK0393518.1 FAD-dependent 5-carboxymethylaminomethyl-2-thiouridine(34) oxidoreductase MnmC [Ramlibacter algicola]